MSRTQLSSSSNAPEYITRPDSFEDFFENGALPLHQVAADGTILRANKAELALLGYSLEEYVGHHVAEFHADQDVIADILERLGRGEILNRYPARLRARDGSIKHVEINSSVLFSDGDFLNTRCFTVDVSDQVRVRAEVERRINQLSAINRFSEILHLSKSLSDVYDGALDAIVNVLGCSRASIRIFDASQDLKFAAWRGLSKTYRDTVQTVETRELNSSLLPLFVDDVEHAEIPEGLKQAMKTEGIHAFTFIPLIADGTLIGRFNGYYDTVSVIEAPDRDIANTVSRQVALGIERARAAVQLRQNEERLRLATNTGKIGVWEWDIVSNQVTWSESLH
ncbi:MAG: PAS domain S-box protein, partial [Acidiferrobacterales bacterium]|nr:PAS domain S-box protein [Acidiferrobacterales bacterium]